MRRRVKFGRTSWQYQPSAHHALVPQLCAQHFPSANTAAGRSVLADLEWLLQKDILAQDACLVGPPGPYRRRLVSYFCELTGRELESVVLSQDTSEADLKQRRDIRDGTVVLTPQAPLRAAVLGRVLLLDGIEKAERNVLPTLNNLLENREMNLLRGQRLVSPWHPTTADDAGNQTGEDLFSAPVLRAKDSFRCVALQLPVPVFPGQPIDPPLRSRFQGRVCGGPATLLTPQPDGNVDGGRPSKSGSSTMSQRESLSRDEALGLLRTSNPDASARFLEAYLSLVEELQDIRAGCSANVPMLPLEPMLRSALPPVLPHDATAMAQATNDEQKLAAATRAAAASVLFERFPLSQVGVLTPRDTEGFAALPSFNQGVGMQEGVAAVRDHIRRVQEAHFAIVGPRGCGKSLSLLAAIEDVRPESTVRVMTCYNDMTTRDLFQRRVMDDQGDSTWIASPVVIAAQEGSIVVLDGIHRCVPSVVAALASLLDDGEASLPSGERLMQESRFEIAAAREAQLRGIDVEEAGEKLKEEHNILLVKEGFLVVGVAEPGSHTHPWLTTETMSLFPGGFINFRASEGAEAIQLASESLKHANDDDAASPAALEALHNALAALSDSGVQLSQRLLVRLARDAAVAAKGSAVGSHRDLSSTVVQHLRRSLLLPFRPRTIQQAITGALEKRGFEQELAEGASDDDRLDIEFVDTNQGVRWGPANASTKALRIGANGPLLTVNESVTQAELVPAVSSFHVIQSQMRLLQRVTRDMAAGERYMLLIGNQGTGKNKLTDRLLGLLNMEREYIQLHRDTSVQSLTLMPSLEGRVLSWELSPLVRAAVDGRVAVVDEADKAPLEVVVLLKALLCDEHLTLLDGRTLRKPKYAGETAEDAARTGDLLIHDDFRVIVLANRPGFPFLGNDFFRECGDIFACHIVDNPDVASALQLIEGVAPSVPRILLSKLAAAFGTLREKHESGDLAYPFSARELVAVARHLEAFPSASVASALQNVTAFDTFSGVTLQHVEEAFEANGLVVDGAPQASLGAAAYISEFATSASLFARDDAAWEKSESQGVLEWSQQQVHQRIISNEIAQPWRDHSSKLRSFLSPRTYSFTELLRVGTLPFAGTPYKKTPVAIVPLADSIRKDQDRAQDAAKDETQSAPGFLVLGAPCSLFVLNNELNTCREIDCVFSSSGISNLTKLDGGAWSDVGSGDWVVMDSTKTGALYLLHVSSGTLRSVQLPASVFAATVESHDLPRPKGVPVIMKQGRRYEHAETVVLTHCSRDGLYVVVNRATGAFTAVRLSPSARDPSEAFSGTLPSFVESRIGTLHAATVHGAGDTAALKLWWSGRTANDADALFETQIEFATGRQQTVRASVEPSTKVVALALAKDSSASVVLAMRDGAATHGKQRASTLHLYTVPTLHADVATSSGAQSTLVADLPPQMLPPHHTAHFFPPSLCRRSGAASNVASSVSCSFAMMPDPKAALTAESSNDNVYVATATVDLAPAGSAVAPVGLHVRRVNLGAGHPKPVTMSVAGDGSHLLMGDVSSGVAVLQMGDKELKQARKEWESQMGRDGQLSNDGDEAPGAAGTNDSFVADVDANGVETQLELIGLPRSVAGDVKDATNGDDDAAAQPGDDGGSPDSQSGGAGFGEPDADDEADGRGQGSGSGVGAGQGSGFGSGQGSGGGASGSGTGTGADKESDGLGGFDFDSEGEVVIKARRKRQTMNTVMSAAATGDAPYDQHLENVADSIALVAASIEALEATQKERVWLGNSTFGELDDRKLVDAIAGEPTVFQRRGLPNLPSGMPQRQPKYMDLVVDLSASMARFNNFDGRLDRLCESLVLLMEAGRGLEHKLVFEVHAHSGSAVRLPLLVAPSVYTENSLEKSTELESDMAKDAPASIALSLKAGAVSYDDLSKPSARADVVAKAVSHSRMSMTGDGTVEGLKLALQNAAENVDSDEAFVVLVSDANLGGYGIGPDEIAQLIDEYRNQGVRTHVVFIAEEQAADWFVRKLPPGSASICTETSDLPHVLCTIWTEALLGL